MHNWADHSSSCADWLAWRTGRTLSTAREDVRVAHKLEELPLTAEAMKSGQLSYTKARTLTRAATPETEATLLEYAQSISAARGRERRALPGRGPLACTAPRAPRPHDAAAKPGTPACEFGTGG